MSEEKRGMGYAGPSDNVGSGGGLADPPVSISTDRKGLG